MPQWIHGQVGVISMKTAGQREQPEDICKNIVRRELVINYEQTIF